MGARTNFWLYVHELFLCLDEEGRTQDERLSNILSSLEAMPPMARAEVVAQLQLLTADLMALEPALLVERMKAHAPQAKGDGKGG